MNNSHPRRLKGITYFLVILSTLLFSVVTGVNGANMEDQETYIARLLATLSGGSFIIFVLFVIPFLIYAVKYWRLTYKSIDIPPADSQLHMLPVKYSANFFAKLNDNIFSKEGSLEWSNSQKIIRLYTADTTIFEAPFGAVQTFAVELNALSIKVNGISYMCYADSRLIKGLIVGGFAAGNQMATVVAGSEAFNSVGIPELAGRMRLEGVRVVYTNVNRAVEVGFNVGFMLVVGLIAFIVVKL